MNFPLIALKSLRHSVIGENVIFLILFFFDRAQHFHDVNQEDSAVFDHFIEMSKVDLVYQREIIEFLIKSSMIFVSRIQCSTMVARACSCGPSSIKQKKKQVHSLELIHQAHSMREESPSKHIISLVAYFYKIKSIKKSTYWYRYRRFKYTNINIKVSPKTNASIYNNYRFVHNESHYINSDIIFVSKTLCPSFYTNYWSFIVHISNSIQQAKKHSSFQFFFLNN